MRKKQGIYAREKIRHICKKTFITSNVLNVQHLTLPSFSSKRDHEQYLHHYSILDEHPIAVHSSLGSREDLSSFSPALKYMMQLYKFKLHYSQTTVGMGWYLNVNSCRFSNLNVTHRNSQVLILTTPPMTLIRCLFYSQSDQHNTNYCFLNVGNILSF